MKRIFSRLFMVMFIALALCACTNTDSDFVPVSNSGQSESNGEGEDVSATTAVLVVAPYDKAAAEVQDWGADLADFFDLEVAVGFTGLPADDTTAAAYPSAAAAVATLKALDPAPSQVVVFKLVAIDDGNADTDDIATRMEDELAGALSAFGEDVIVERVNGFGYGTGQDDFMVKYLKARLDEFRAVIENRKSAKSVGLITKYADKMDGDLAESVVIVPVEEYFEIITSQQATDIAKLLGVRKVVFVRNEIDLLEWDESLFHPIIDDIDDALFSNVLSKGHRIIIPYLSSPADILSGFDQLNTSQINCGRLMIFNSSIIDDDTSLSIIKTAVEAAE